MKKEFIKWKDEDYRDDRMMVMNIAPAKDAEGKDCWNLTTYRNTIRLPIYRNDFFTTEAILMNYIQRVEPMTPLISRNEERLEIPSNIDENDDKAIWKHYNEWLIKEGLFSAVTGTSHVPFYIDQRGYTEKVFTTKVTEIGGIITEARKLHD